MVRPLLRWLQLTEIPRARKRCRRRWCACVQRRNFFPRPISSAISFVGMTKVERGGQCGANADIFRRELGSLSAKRKYLISADRTMFSSFAKLFRYALRFVMRSYNTGKFERAGKQRVKVEIASRVYLDDDDNDDDFHRREASDTKPCWRENETRSRSSISSRPRIYEYNQ